jgi:hypothetical protein
VHTTVEVLHVVTLVFGALAVGGAAYEGFVIFPTVLAAEGEDGANILRTLRMYPQNPRYVYLPASGLLSGLPALAAVVLWNHQRQASAVLTLLGFALFLAALVMNLLYWGLGARSVYHVTVTPDGVLPRLAVRNAARAAFYGAGFVLFAVAAVVD